MPNEADEQSCLENKLTNSVDCSEQFNPLKRTSNELLISNEKKSKLNDEFYNTKSSNVSETQNDTSYINSTNKETADINKKPIIEAISPPQSKTKLRTETKKPFYKLVDEFLRTKHHTLNKKLLDSSSSNGSSGDLSQLDNELLDDIIYHDEFNIKKSLSTIIDGLRPATTITTTVRCSTANRLRDQNSQPEGNYNKTDKILDIETESIKQSTSPRTPSPPPLPPSPPSSPNHHDECNSKITKVCSRKTDNTAVTTTINNNMDEVISNGGSDMDISEVSDHLDEADKEKNEELYLQSLAKPVTPLAAQSVIRPQTSIPQNLFIPPYPQHNYSYIQPQPILSYNNNILYPNSMNINPPSHIPMTLLQQHQGYPPHMPPPQFMRATGIGTNRVAQNQPLTIGGQNNQNFNQLYYPNPSYYGISNQTTSIGGNLYQQTQPPMYPNYPNTIGVNKHQNVNPTEIIPNQPIHKYDNTNLWHSNKQITSQYVSKFSNPVTIKNENIINDHKQLHNQMGREDRMFNSLPWTAKDYINKKYGNNNNSKMAAITSIYNDYCENWLGISKIWGERSVDSFEIQCQVGEGTYGKVYRAKDLFRNEIVALKKIRNDFDREGFPITAVREIKILRQLKHKNIVKLRDVISDKSDVSEFLSSQGSFYLVFEYMEHDLMGVLESNRIEFNIPQIQSMFKQLMSALNYCHSLNFLHRDLKCSNILINNQGVLKLADFGLARLYESEGRPYTNRVITLWYRPPELLFGQERYGPYVDIWSAGCILGELFTKRPILPGNREIVQIDLIFKLCGSPTLKSWPDVIHLPCYQTMKPSVIYPRKLKEHFHFLPQTAVNLLDAMLQLDPHQRILSRDVLESDFLRDIDPSKVEPPKFPESQNFHELLMKRKNKLNKEKQRKMEMMRPNNADTTKITR